MIKYFTFFQSAIIIHFQAQYFFKGVGASAFSIQKRVLREKLSRPGE